MCADSLLKAHGGKTCIYSVHIYLNAVGIIYINPVIAVRRHGILISARGIPAGRVGTCRILADRVAAYGVPAR